MGKIRQFFDDVTGRSAQMDRQNARLKEYRHRRDEETKAWKSLEGDILGRSAAYTDASHNRLTNTFFSNFSTADQLGQINRAQLVRRSHALIRNNSVARGMVRTQVDAIVGRGYKVQSLAAAPSPDGTTLADGAQFAKEAEAFFREAAEQADAEGFLNFQEKLSQIVAAWHEGGDVLVHFPRRSAPWRMVTSAIDAIEADRIFATGGATVGDRQVQYIDGVERDAVEGDVRAYWAFPFASGNATALKGSPVRIPLYVQEDGRWITNAYLLAEYTNRPGQSRGRPWLTSTLVNFHYIDSYIETELVAARAAACFVAFLKKKNVGASRAGAKTGTDRNGNGLMDLQPGRIHFIGQNDDVIFGNPNRPGAAFGEFVDELLTLNGRAVDMPSFLVKGDFSQVNFSSARAGMIGFWRQAEKRQRTLAGSVIKPYYQRVITDAVRTGQLSPRFWSNPKARAMYLRASCIPPGRQLLDPDKEIRASALSIATGLSTNTEELAKLGKDFEEVTETRKREKEALEEAGLSTLPVEIPNISLQGAPEESPSREVTDDDVRAYIKNRGMAYLGDMIGIKTPGQKEAVR